MAKELKAEFASEAELCATFIKIFTIMNRGVGA